MQNCSIKRSSRHRIRVVVVDDSALMRQMLTAILNADSGIEVVGVAPDPLCARQMIKDLDPDVITLDVEMPKMDGLTFLEKIMKLRPMPVIMVSSLTKKGADTTIKALECGALDFVAKPAAAAREGFEVLRSTLVPKIKAAVNAQFISNNEKERYRPSRNSLIQKAPVKIIGIGASTGGVIAIQTIISKLPFDTPGIVITQHMPPGFTKSFASRLNQNSQITVSEATDGEHIKPGHAYVAPGGRHLEVSRGQSGYICRLQDEALVSGHRPSVDVLFHSIAEKAGSDALGVILTGMGRDGANGLLSMRRAGALTFGQSQKSCIVYGMPRAASEIDAVNAELSLADITREISSVSKKAIFIKS